MSTDDDILNYRPLRPAADDQDDPELYEPQTTLTSTKLVKPKAPISDSEDAAPADGGTVDPASPGATSANGIIHGGL